MIITIGNYKGGVGKTTTSKMIAYLLSERHDKKTLVVDTDPQTNLTTLLFKTYQKENDRNKNIYEAVFDKDTRNNIQTLSRKLDIISGSWNMDKFEAEARKVFYADKISYVLEDMILQIKDDYDFIIIDTAPRTNLVMENVLMLTDYVLIPTQTVPLAFESTLMFYDYLLEYYLSDETHFSLLGVLPYLVGRSITDIELLKEYKKEFEEELFSSQIRSSDRVKTWSRYGITTDQPYDKVTLEMYDEVIKEILERIERKESNENRKKE